MERKVTVIPAKQKSLSTKSTSKSDKLKVAAYCRVSTEQEEQQNSFENQVDYYTKYINSRPEYTLVDIYADEGISGTNTKKRKDFNRMIADAQAGKLDYIITKSISRFARNTSDSLNNLRLLKGLGINVFFEKEGINSMDATGELLITILSSLAQEESRNISENCKWGIRSNFQKGKVHLNTTYFLGFDKDEEGNLIINPAEAEIVRRIYASFLEGMTYSQIGCLLRDEGVKSARGTTSWAPGTIKQMLMNEKYKGDVIMQKTYTADFLTKKEKKNNGELPQYFIENHHEGIVSKDIWDATQLEIARREAYKTELGIATFGNMNVDNPFLSKVICGKCGKVMIKQEWKSRDVCYYKCRDKGKGCHSDNIDNKLLLKAFRIAWNDIVTNMDSHQKVWNVMVETGDPLEKLRAEQFISQAEAGKITTDIPELIRLTLERIVVLAPDSYEVRFLDGTIKNVIL